MHLYIVHIVSYPVVKQEAIPFKPCEMFARPIQIGNRTAISHRRAGQARTHRSHRCAESARCVARHKAWAQQDPGRTVPCSCGGLSLCLSVRWPGFVSSQPQIICVFLNFAVGCPLRDEQVSDLLWRLGLFAGASVAVKFFSKLNLLNFGYLDPMNIFFW